MRASSGLLLLALCLACDVSTEDGGAAEGAEAALQVVKGDANGDGTISAEDALSVAQRAQGMSPAPFYPEAADVDCDGAITLDDATRIAEYSSGTRHYFPECLGTIQYDQYDYPERWASQLTLTDLNDYYCARVEMLNDTRISTAVDWRVTLELGGSTLSTGFGAAFSVSGGTLTATALTSNRFVAPGARATFEFCGFKPTPDARPVIEQGYFSWAFSPAPYQLYKSPHWSVVSHRNLGAHVVRVLDSVEACYEIAAVIAGPTWTAATDGRIDPTRKTIAYTPELPGHGGHGNQHWLEAPLPSTTALSDLGTRYDNWILFYEGQRGGSAPWHEYLAYHSQDIDWSSAFSHSVAITCSEAFGSGPQHPNVGIVNSALPAWVNLASRQTWLDLLDHAPDRIVTPGGVYGINDVFGAMLAELYRLHGITFFQAMVNELTDPAKGYPPALTPRQQACNFVRASAAVTHGATIPLMVGQWRFPGDCS